jgi:protein involved in polysaccharide export with SLBB domain
LIGRVTLSQAIPSAGNFTEWANDRKIILARGQERYVINFREIASDPTKDIELQPGDVVTVERRSFL